MKGLAGKAEPYRNVLRQSRTVDRRQLLARLFFNSPFLYLVL
jgi:hypothetical protein